MTALAGFPNMLNFWPGGTAPSISNMTLNQTTDQLEFIFQAHEATAITRFGVRQGSITGTAPTYIASLQGVDASGNPDGTIKGGGSPVSVTWQPIAGNNNTYYWTNFTNSYTPGRGEKLALVIAYSSGTIDVSNNVSFGITNVVANTYGIPYAIQNDNGTRTKQTTTPLFGWGTAGIAFGFPVNTVANSSYNSGSTPDEKAILFNIPTTFCSTYKIDAVMLYCTLAAAGAFDLVLYDTDGTTVLQQTSFDTDHDNSAASARQRPLHFDDAPATLNAGSTYRLSFLPTTGSVTLPSITVAAQADLDAYAFGQSWASASSRTNAGAWTDDPLTRYGINPILSDLTQPAAGGGLLKVGGMHGGMQRT